MKKVWRKLRRAWWRIKLAFDPHWELYPRLSCLGCGVELKKVAVAGGGGEIWLYIFCGQQSKRCIGPENIGLEWPSDKEILTFEELDMMGFEQI